MIFQLFFNGFFVFISSLISAMPDFVLLAIPWAGVGKVIGYGVYIIGPTTFALITANILFWSTVHFLAACGAWIYNKIPFV